MPIDTFPTASDPRLPKPKKKLKAKPPKKKKRHPVPSLADKDKAGLVNTNTEKMLKELGY